MVNKLIDEFMKILFHKYFDDNLTDQEFREFKKLLNSCSDEEIEKILFQLWDEELGEEFYFQKMLEIKRVVDNNIKKTRHSKFRKLLQIAAVIIPFVIITTFIFYNTKNKVSTSCDMIVSVEEGERANIILPDSTKVNLNAQSLLRYNVNEFNCKERRISFSGEAYFEIAKNNNKPFIIQTNHMEVRVVGTSFNLKARDENAFTEIDLLEGKVDITSNKTKETLLLLHHQKAILDKKSGEIKILPSTPLESFAWRNGQLVFHGIDIKQVFREIERAYGVKFQINNDTLPYDFFTGTFFTNNLNETLDVLKLHYQFDYVIKGDKIFIYNFELNKAKNMNLK